MTSKDKLIEFLKSTNLNYSLNTEEDYEEDTVFVKEQSILFVFNLEGNYQYIEVID